MKTKMMIALMLLTSSVSMASTKVVCAVNAEGSTPNHYDRALGQAQGELSAKQPLEIYDFGDERAYGTISEDGNLSIVVGSPQIIETRLANKNWSALALGGKDLVVLGLGARNVMISCGAFKTK